MIYTFEGIDGCGKSSVAVAVAKAIKARLIEFPNYNSPTGKIIKGYLRGEWYTVCNEGDRDRLRDAVVFQSLNVANRMERMEELAAAANHIHNHLVLVRYWQSGWVYGQLDGLDKAWLSQVHRSMVLADQSFLIDVLPTVALDRCRQRDGAKAPERYEGKLHLLQRTAELYRRLWLTPHDNVVTLDGSKTLDHVVRVALRAIKTDAR